MTTGTTRTRRIVRPATLSPPAAATATAGPSHPPDSSPPRFVRWLGPLVVAGMLLGHVAATGGTRYPTGPAEGRSLSGSAAAPVSRSTLRLATFNIHGGRNAAGRADLGRTADSLLGLDLDLVALNEVRGAFPWQEADQAEALGQALDLPWLFAPTEVRWWRDDYGNALLCRLPVSQWRRTPLPGTQHRGYRAALLTEVKLAGQTVHVLSTHIDRQRDRQEQLRLVVEWFLTLPEPAVLLGDLNSTGDDPYLQRMLHHPGVRDPLSESQTNPSPKRIDWILTRGLRTLKAGVIDSGASDHPAYWAEVELER